ncbi:hypothetical protein CO2235_MP10056 [Cupriavidus oxalaticus]|uniref:Uncharacterized protein n=1 Tax=Cupriavidus oxalaticus TaxID=96344 RepID=A0A976BG00_9BURK|nr:hypothetical protein CO2235_MP10056 [Cupriavidus oxalaticus]
METRSYILLNVSYVVRCSTYKT